MNADRSGPAARAIILAGGKGRRLQPYTTILPKPLMPVGDLPILEILIRQLRRNGVESMTLAVGYLAPLIEAYCGGGERWGVKIDYSHEREPLGTAGPLSLVSGVASSTLVLNGDLLTDLDFGDMLRFHREREATVTVGIFDRDVQMSLGVLEVDDGDAVTDYVEKPTLRYQVSMGIYVIEPRVLDYLAPGAYCDFPDLIKTLIAANERVLGYRGATEWLDIGRPDDYKLAVERFAEMENDLGL